MIKERSGKPKDTAKRSSRPTRYHAPQSCPCHPSLPPLTATPHCLPSLPPLTATPHCHPSLPPLTATPHCHPSLHPLTATPHCHDPPPTPPPPPQASSPFVCLMSTILFLSFTTRQNYEMRRAIKESLTDLYRDCAQNDLT